MNTRDIWIISMQKRKKAENKTARGNGENPIRKLPQKFLRLSSGSRNNRLCRKQKSWTGVKTCAARTGRCSAMTEADVGARMDGRVSAVKPSRSPPIDSSVPLAAGGARYAVLRAPSTSQSIDAPITTPTPNDAALHFRFWLRLNEIFLRWFL